MLSRSFLNFSVGVVAFVIGLNQISSFFSFRRISEKSKDSHMQNLPFYLLTSYSGKTTLLSSQFYGEGML